MVLEKKFRLRGKNTNSENICFFHNWINAIKKVAGSAKYKQKQYEIVFI